MAGAGTDESDVGYSSDGGGLYTFNIVVSWTSVTSHSMFESGGDRLTADQVMGKAHKNCIIGQKFCLHHITGTAFIIRLKLNVYIVENSDRGSTFQKIYSFMQFK